MYISSPSIAYNSSSLLIESEYSYIVESNRPITTPTELVVNPGAYHIRFSHPLTPTSVTSLSFHHPPLCIVSLG